MQPWNPALIKRRSSLHEPANPLGYDLTALFNTARHLDFLSLTIRHVPLGRERDGAVADIKVELDAGPSSDPRQGCQ
jgi:hypothetical protein